MARPTTDDWRNAQKLIKNLFLQAKHRQCIQLCRNLLAAHAADDAHDAHPLQDAYINFYLGLCFTEVARMMHHNSVAKLPAYDDAERHFLEALTALPTAKDARALCLRHIQEEAEDPFVVRQVNNPHPFPSPLADSGLFDRPCSRASSLMLSSPEQRPADAPRTASETSPASPVLSLCDMEDLESHHSFADLMTPSRVRRDSPELILSGEESLAAPAITPTVSPPASDPTPKPSSPGASPPHHQASPTAGLMRPVRMGSFPKPYQDRLPTTRPGPKPKLSRLSIDIRSASAPQLNRLSSIYHCEERASPVSPVSLTSSMSFGSSVSPISPISPIATDGLERGSDTTTTSAITPNTPNNPACARFGVAQIATVEAVSAALVTSKPTFQPKECLDVGKFNRMTAHLAAMRIQLETHMKAVQRAQEQIHRTQALERLETPLSSDGDCIQASTILPTSPNGSFRQRSVRKNRSFWSFVPEDQKARKKKERIEAGRARCWKKERFDPTKYQTLCEQALAEL